MAVRHQKVRDPCRSREGAWIEIAAGSSAKAANRRRSREGAWIEIRLYLPVRNISMSRSREGAWIEIPTLERLWPYGYVAPVRERGLKCTGKYNREGSARSLP